MLFGLISAADPTSFYLSLGTGLLNAWFIQCKKDARFILTFRDNGLIVLGGSSVKKSPVEQSIVSLPGNT
jgi:hypothetical protein